MCLSKCIIAQLISSLRVFFVCSHIYEKPESKKWWENDYMTLLHSTAAAAAKNWNEMSNWIRMNNKKRVKQQLISRKVKLSMQASFFYSSSLNATFCRLLFLSLRIMLFNQGLDHSFFPHFFHTYVKSNMELHFAQSHLKNKKIASEKRKKI